MQFTVPKYIDPKTKVIGPFEFWQFFIAGVIAVFGFVVYVTMPFWFFLFAIFSVGGGALVLMFVQIEGRSIPTFIKNFLLFKAMTKIYLWRKGMSPPKYILEKPEVKEKTKKDASPLKVAGESRLRKIATEIEMKTK